MLGGGVDERWNDKHVTQNGSNQAPITDGARQGESRRPRRTFAAARVEPSVHCGAVCLFVPKFAT